MTDGKTMGSAQLPANAEYNKKFNSTDIEIIAVGITPDSGSDGYNKDELVVMSGADNLIEVSSFDAFESNKIADKIFYRAC